MFLYEGILDVVICFPRLQHTQPNVEHDDFLLQQKKHRVNDFCVVSFYTYQVVYMQYMYIMHTIVNYTLFHVLYMVYSAYHTAAAPQPHSQNKVLLSWLACFAFTFHFAVLVYLYVYCMCVLPKAKIWASIEYACRTRVTVSTLTNFFCIYSTRVHAAVQLLYYVMETSQCTFLYILKLKANRMTP